VNSQSQFDIDRVVAALYRRKGLIAAVFLVVFLLAVYLSFRLPDVYRSSTLILISPQSLPASFVSSTVTSPVQERISSIIQQILSRTSLEKIVADFNLYFGERWGSTMEDRVQRLRKHISIEINRSTNRARTESGPNGFELSYRAETPEKAAQVTARLASLFIDENLKIREQQAIGTKKFMHTEAERLRKELEEQEALVNAYRAKYQYQLPDQLDANLRTLEQLRNELQNNLLRLMTLQERKASLDAYLVDPTAAQRAGVTGQDSYSTVFIPGRSLLEDQRTQLEILRRKYSDKHPDVIRLEQEVQALELKALDQEPQTKTVTKAPSPNSMPELIRRQVSDVSFEINSLKQRNELLRSKIASYQERIDSTPARTIELSKISRNYEITLKKYQDLQAKSLESELAENMEKKQKGEQFHLQDPPSFPTKPDWPNRPMIIILGFFGGLIGGIGLALILENFDTSFRNGEEIASLIKIPLIAEIPAVMSRSTVLDQRRPQAILLMGSTGIFVVGFVLIHFLAAKFY